MPDLRQRERVSEHGGEGGKGRARDRGRQKRQVDGTCDSGDNDLSGFLGA